MVCRTCAEAADRGAPPSQHCRSTGGPGSRCDCQHRPPRTTGTSPTSGGEAR
jgi:hypothetical protein